jgi:predicted methyltransferase
VAALVMLAMTSACSPSSTHHGATVPAAAAGPALRTGVTERMPPDEAVSTDSLGSNRAQAIVMAPDRSEGDRRLDDERRPAELLTFLGVDPGWRVAVLVAGVGYTAELMARAVAPTGTVYAENPGFVLAQAEGEWSSRLANPAMKPVVRVDRELADPLPPEARDLDLVIINLVYHDAVLLGVDRARMNHAVFDALRPGGRYVVIDHSARPGNGYIDVHALHRIDQTVVQAEVESAGFQLVKEAQFLRNPSDTRNWSASPDYTHPRGDSSDRFVLMFVKP